MASVLKLKTDIKKLKAAIASKATSGAIKTKLRGKLTTLENELDKLQPNKRKPKTTGPKSESALVRIAKKRRTNQGLSTSKSDIERDAIRPAKPAGRRISANGNRYYEYRDNRVDTRQPPKKYRKLANGGGTSDGWYEDFNDGFEKLLTKKYITQDEYEKYQEILNQVDPIDKYGKMSGRAAAKKFVDDNKRYTKMADGGHMADGGMVAKLEKDFASKDLDDDLMMDGYHVEIFDYTEEAEKDRFIKKNSKDNYLVPWDNNDDNYYIVVVPKNKMADGGKTKEQEVVRGYFEDEAYEYGKGGEVMYLSSNGTSQTLVTDKSNATPMWIMDAEYYISSNPKNNAMIVAEKIDETLPDRVGKNYIVKITKKNKMADGGELYPTEPDYEPTPSDYKFIGHGEGSRQGLAKFRNKVDNTILEIPNYKIVNNELVYIPPYDALNKYFEENGDPYIDYDFLRRDKMADGGSVAKGNYEMLMSQAKEVMHHAEELMKVAKPDMDVEAWVVAKAERATTDLSDITHYLDGLKMAMGGMVKHNEHKVNA